MYSCGYLGIATQIVVLALIVALFVSIGVLVLLHACIVGRAIRRGASTMARAERLNVARSGGLSTDELEELPCYDFKGKGSPSIHCIICLESFQMGERCRLLPLCKHSFHAHCVDPWLSNTPICPICRTKASQSSHRSSSA